MTKSPDKTLVQSFLNISVTDPEKVREYLAPDFVAHLPSGPQNHEGFLGQLHFFGAAFSNQKFIIKDTVAEEDKVVIYAEWQGTHSGEFMGFPATGSQITINAFTLDRVRDGKIVEHWSLFDMARMMQQLGTPSTP